MVVQAEKEARCAAFIKRYILKPPINWKNPYSDFWKNPSYLSLRGMSDSQANTMWKNWASSVISRSHPNDRLFYIVMAGK
jgi:hypothetical protein